MKKALAVLLAVMTAVTLFVSCGNDPFYHEVKIKYEDRIVKTEIVKDGDEYTLPKEVEGIPEISGWTYDEKEYDTGDKITVTSDITITAVVGTPVVITLYDEVTKTVYVEKGQTELTLPEAPERAGYDFDGWDVDGTTYAAGKNVTYTEGMKIKGIWTRYYTITYNVNGGKGSVAQGKLREDNTEGVKIAGGTELKNGDLFFSGWNTQADGKGTAYASDDVYKTNADLNLYAVWSSEIAIIYKSEGHDDVKVTGSPTDMKTLTPDWTNDGYQFDGWYTGENGAGTYYAAGADISISTTLYAHWVDENLSFTKYPYEEGFSVDVKSDKKSTVQNITIPSVWHGVAVTVVDNFMECNELISVVIPSSVTKIDYYGFQNCAKLKTINFPESLTLIDHEAFEGCSSLEKIEIKGNLTSISYEAFRDCSSLKEVILPSTIESIDGLAFKYCTSLTSIDLSGTKVKSMDVRVFEGCTALTSVKLPSTLETIDRYTFMDCTSLTAIDLPDSLTTIEYEVFARTGLTSIYIPENVTTLGDDAFNGCSALTTINMGMTEAAAQEAGFAKDKPWGATSNPTVNWGVKI